MIGIRILFLFFSLGLVGISILCYLIIQELELNQKQIKDIYLTQSTLSEQIKDIIDYLVSQANESGD